MSKKFKGKTCIYCMKNSSTSTGDHVFAREFFLEERRANLPKVPACTHCNNEKSKLEHYLTAILPFGGRHSDAHVNLQTMVPDRLAKNAKLYRQLASGRAAVLSEELAGFHVATTALPFDSGSLRKFFAYIVKGLLWHHWRVTLAAEFDTSVMLLTNDGEGVFSRLLDMNARHRVRENVGESTFFYEGAQGNDYPEFSVWKFNIYGGVKLAGDPVAPMKETSCIGVITAKKSYLQDSAITALV